MTIIDSTTGEITDLAHYEGIIARGLRTFYDVGNALLAIRDGSLYKAAGYRTFEDYCRDRWDMQRGHAHRLINASCVISLLSPIGDKLPANEAQARPLIAFRDSPDILCEAWQRVIASADGRPITARLVEQIVTTLAEELREKDPPPPLPPGKYHTIVIDPPWEMQKIQRDVRPRQVTLDYPQMGIDEIQAFPIPDLAADDCHLYLWTTHKYLPDAIAIAEQWGFNYQCLLTWVKNVGITPFSWMYSTEHALFCRKGGLDLLQMGRRLDIHAAVREHSRKPDEFYTLVCEVSPAPRLDIFAREHREGFDVWGNETAYFKEEIDAIA